MMTQEEFINVKALRAAGWTVAQIARHLGYHSVTISSWLKTGGPPAKRSVPVEELVIDERWRGAGRRAPGLQRRAAGHLDHAGAAGRGFRGLLSEPHPSPPRRAGTVAVEGVGGHGADRDRPRRGVPVRWSDCNRWARQWGWEGELHCFGAVLCWSRIKCWWFASSIDQPHTFEGLVRFFEAVDGVPAVGRTDRMGCLGRSGGKAFIWQPPALEFARHHGFALKACDAGDAARKG